MKNGAWVKPEHHFSWKDIGDKKGKKTFCGMSSLEVWIEVERSGKEKITIVIIGALFLLGSFFWLGRQVAAVNQAKIEISNTENSQGLTEPDAGEEEENKIYIHVVGEVKHPGFYQVEEGCRVFNAIEAAGGATEKADLDAVNLAALVHDGEQVRIPPLGEAQAAPQISHSAGAQESGLVNINTAGVRELDTLPGIGEVTAQRIVQYREENGPFPTIEDIQKVSGIGPKKFAQIQELITVY